MRFVTFAALMLMSCPPGGNINGTLRANQVTLFEGAHWQDARCSEGENFANCCIRNERFCPDFVDYLITDVRTKGSRIAVLFQVNSGNTVLLSDDSGATWKTVPVGSVAGMAQLQKMGLHLAGDDIYLMVQFTEPIGAGTRVVLRPYKVDLATGATAWERDVYFFSRPHAFSDEAGTAYAAMLHPQDARDPFSPCVALFERWTPGGMVVRESVVTGLSSCGEFFVDSANDARFFGGVLAQEGRQGRSCSISLDAATKTIGSSCVSWGQWPAARDATLPRRFAAYAHERAQYLGVFEADGAAWASPAASSEWIFLGSGAPGRNRSLSDNQPYAGLMPVGNGLVRINRDATVDDVLLPLSPCTGTSSTCMDPKNAQTFHGEVGDLLWAHPLGDDDYLLFYVHDLAPGINQYKPIFTMSKEKATYRRVEPRAKPTGLGPPGYPNALPAGPIEELCIKLSSCQPLPTNLYDCMGRYTTQHELVHTAYEATMASVAGADCSNLLLRGSGALDCALRGGTPVERDGGTNLYVDCDYGVPVAPTTCGVCDGHVVKDCSGLGGGGMLPVRCSASPGASCQQGRCVAATPCTGDGLTTCEGTQGVRCWMGMKANVRCDLLNMDCEPSSMATALRPCKPRGSSGVTATGAPRCEGAYLVWDLSGQKYADCTALGFGGCMAGACVR